MLIDLYRWIDFEVHVPFIFLSSCLFVRISFWKLLSSSWKRQDESTRVIDVLENVRRMLMTTSREEDSVVKH